MEDTILNYDLIKIVNNIIYYKNDINKYKLELMSHYGMLDGKLSAIFTIEITISYKGSLKTRKINRRSTNIPKKHKEIILALMEYFENIVVMPMMLQGKDMNYINWLE